MNTTIWQHCLDRLGTEIPNQQFNTWIRPLHCVQERDHLRLMAPNAFVLDWVKKHYLERVRTYLSDLGHGDELDVSLEIGGITKPTSPEPDRKPDRARSADVVPVQAETRTPGVKSNTNPDFTFESFVEGKSNQLARAAGMQIGDKPGVTYNPLFIYGGVGLGKTHLMHAVGNRILHSNPNAQVLYMHSESFVAEMVKALQHGTIDEFKRRMRSVNALLIDDVQFFAGKERSQEEFFHTFNALFECQQQIILTSDRFPKEVDGLEDRLKSRFGWGLTVAVEPPDFETRVAILKAKSLQLFSVELPNDVAYLIGKGVRHNIRELEGALRRLFANAQFTGEEITVEFARKALSDILANSETVVSIERIQKAVAEYYKVRVNDLLSSRRNRTIARPRQVAMTLAKELTDHSLPEIGDKFGGRDHTTVLYATRRIKELREQDQRVNEDYNNLLKTLSY